LGPSSTTASGKRVSQLGNPKHVGRQIFVTVFQDRTTFRFILGVEVALRVAGCGIQALALAVEGVRDVLQEQEAENEVLVLGRFDAAAQSITGLEQLLGEWKIPAVQSAAARHGLGGYPACAGCLCFRR
jgi:hypothetical protein